MKVAVKLANGKYYHCNIKESNQLEAAAKAAVKGQFYGCLPVFLFTHKP